jgi:hypothetical protein
MKTTKQKIYRGYKVTREDGEVFNVRKRAVRRGWVIENADYWTTSARTLASAICDIAHSQSKVTGWKPKQ